MVQLELLDLMIRKECGAVPMDAAIRADLIDLMARILVAVFHEEGRGDDDRDLVQSQDQARASGSQGDRLFRQSSDKQVRQNLESQRLQYEVAERIRSWDGGMWRSSTVILAPVRQWRRRAEKASNVCSVR